VEAEALLEVEADDLSVVFQIADRDVLSGFEQEVIAAYDGGADVTDVGSGMILPMSIGSTRTAEWRATAPTAPIAAAGLIAGFGAAVASGSRPLGGVVLAGCGLSCLAVWLHRDGWRTAAGLTVAGLGAFAASHVLGHAIGSWPAVFVVSALTAGLCWRYSDSRRTPTALTPRATAGSPITPLPADRPEASA
jgi:hypothetical protein